MCFTQWWYSVMSACLSISVGMSYLKVLFIFDGCWCSFPPLYEVQFILLNVTVHKKGGGIVYLHGLGSKPHQHLSSSQRSEVYPFLWMGSLLLICCIVSGTTLKSLNYILFKNYINMCLDIDIIVVPQHNRIDMLKLFLLYYLQLFIQPLPLG